MFDIGWTELLVIGIVALIVVGPKDLPGMFRTVGNFVGKARRMAREFSRAMNEAADEAGVGDVKRSLDVASNPMKSAMDEVRKSTEGFTARTMAGPRAEIDDERKAQVEKIRQRTAEVASERRAREAAEAGTGQGTAPPEADVPAGKPAAEKPARAKASPASKPAAKQPAARKPAAKKPAASKPATRSEPARSAPAKAPARKPAARKAPKDTKA